VADLLDLAEPPAQIRPAQPIPDLILNRPRQPVGSEHQLVPPPVTSRRSQRTITQLLVL
jgi:hypothetical protein